MQPKLKGDKIVRTSEVFDIIIFMTVTKYLAQNDVLDLKYKVCIKALYYGNKRPSPNFSLCNQCINRDFTQGVASFHITTSSDRFMALNLICTAGAANQELLIWPAIPNLIKIILYYDLCDTNDNVLSF